MFTSILTKRLTKWREENQIIDESQAGFRSQYSTIDNIFTLQAIIQKYLSKRRGRFYVFYIDFKKAFEGCDHSKCWACLQRHGIQGPFFFDIFKSMYSQLGCCVKITSDDVDNIEGLGRMLDCHRGTRQSCL